jgi:hypothetical protein
MNRREDPEFKKYRDVSELQEKFFLRDLPELNGKYLYRERGLKIKPQMAVLFQSDKMIIARTTLLDTEKFKEPKEDRGVFYNGALYFDIKSIRVFDPIPWEIVSRIWPEAKTPSHVRYHLNPSGYAEFEEKLENVKRPKGVDKKSSVQILISNAGHGKTLLEKMAATGRKAFWMSPKLTAVGDTVLFYIEEPVSAIVAVGEALSLARATDKKWYEAQVGQVRLLDVPITLTELRAMFPDWAWLRSVNMFAYVSPDRAQALIKRCAIESPATKNERARVVGGGFGDAMTNALVEQAAVRKVIEILKRRGFSVRSRESERIGYDLDATKGKTELHVEVKGVSGREVQFIISKGEVAKAASDPASQLMVVTQARTRKACVHEFHGGDLKRLFALTPVNYFAERK